MWGFRPQHLIGFDTFGIRCFPGVCFLHIHIISLRLDMEWEIGFSIYRNTIYI